MCAARIRRRAVTLIRRLIPVVALSVVLVSAAAGASSNVVTLNAGDVAVFGPLQCNAGAEGGASNFLCARRQAAKYQASIYADSILVWKVGNPDAPVFSTSGSTQAQLRQTVLRTLCGACAKWSVTFSRIRVSKLDEHFAFGNARRIVNAQGQVAQPSPFVLFRAGMRWTVLNMVTDATICRGIPRVVRREFRMGC
jgi:hypothetical protein